MSNPLTIWTPDVGESFFANIYALDAKLEHEKTLHRESNIGPPRAPQDYRSRGDQRSASDQYTLSYEQELHIADHFAFLAHVEEGVKFVSAVTLEEYHNPPSLTIRLASNHTPTADVIKGLEKILDIVKEHALKGIYNVS
jgi:hypothetical protein